MKKSSNLAKKLWIWKNWMREGLEGWKTLYNLQTPTTKYVRWITIKIYDPTPYTQARWLMLLSNLAAHETKGDE